MSPLCVLTGECGHCPGLKNWARISVRGSGYLGLEKRRLRPGPHAVVAVSGLIADQLQQAYGSAHEYPVIAPGVALPQADHQGEERAKVRESLGFSKDQVVCLLVARNPLRKGLSTVLKALAKLPSHHRLLVVGGKPGLRDQMRQQLQALNMQDRVILQGETSNVEPFYRAADVYVHPTLNDSFGMAPLGYVLWPAGCLKSESLVRLCTICSGRLSRLIADSPGKC